MTKDRESFILKYLYNHQDRYVTSQELSEKLDVSIRTVKSDLKTIQSYIESNDFLTIKTVRSKGILLESLDDYQTQQVIKDIESENQIHYNSSDNRLSQLILKLLDRKMTKVELQHYFYISESTLNNDIDKIKNILDHYELIVINDKWSRLSINGKEQDKRKLIGQYKNINNAEKADSFFSIEKIILKILINAEYNVTETVFNNILIHIQISISRIQANEIISEYTMLSNNWQKELDLSRQIFEELARFYHFDIHEGEVINLAILLAGTSDYDYQNYIPDQISNFMDEILIEIDEKFDVNFSSNIESKLNLSLHLVPLLERLRHRVKLPNQMSNYIHQSFPLAFDISAFFSLGIQSKFNVEVTQNEMAYLAIHFNNFLIDHDASLGKKEILIISNIRRSESILLKQRLLTWFKEEVSNVEVLNYSEVESNNIDKYDVIFSTNEDNYTDQFAPILISKFPSDSEYLNIKLAIDGFRGKEDILSLFKKELFRIEKVDSKAGVFNSFEELLESYVSSISRQLMNSVKVRENMSNTYFRNQIAYPHPAIPHSVSSFVSVILLEEPIVWNDDMDKVKIVMLIVIEKNNTKSFQLWNYLTGITKDDMFGKRIEEVSNYNEFLDALSLSIEYNH